MELSRGKKGLVTAIAALGLTAAGASLAPAAFAAPAATGTKLCVNSGYNAYLTWPAGHAATVIVTDGCSTPLPTAKGDKVNVFGIAGGKSFRIGTLVSSGSLQTVTTNGTAAQPSFTVS